MKPYIALTLLAVAIVLMFWWGFNRQVDAKCNYWQANGMTEQERKICP
jgi:hypothetical protein